MIVSLNAAPFQNEANPLRFRAISGALSTSDGYLEGSEACLVHADMQAYWANLTSSFISPETQTFVNTLVRVSYTKAAYEAQNSLLQKFMEQVMGHFNAWAYDIRDWWVQYRLARHLAERTAKITEWESISGQKEVGEFCLTDQLQLLTPWGWAHI